MNAIDKKQSGRGLSWRGLSAALAGLGWLAMCFGANAQVTVDTIGGGVRVECGHSYGFTNGNTYENAQFNAPYSCALDTNGNLWIADKNNSDIEQVSQAGNKATSVTTEYYATSGTSPHVKTNFHFLTNITSVAVDPANNLYVMLPSPPQVYKCDLSLQSPTLNILSYLELTGAPAGAVATAMAVDGNSNVFLAFTNGVIIRFQLLDSNPPPTLYSESYALGASAAVHYIVTNFNWHPSGLALLPNGALAVSDTLSNAIYVVSTNDYTSNPGPQLLTGAHGAGYDDGPPVFAQFDQPHGLAASADGRLIVCDMMNNRLRVIDTLTNTTTLYGTDSSVWTATDCTSDPTFYAGWVDGVAGTTSTNASSRQPVSVTIAPGGSLFVTELYYSLIRQVTNTDFTVVNPNAKPPVAVTEPATAITSNNATLNGTVNPGDAPASYFFEWGATTNYGNFTPTNVLGNNLTTVQNVSMAVSNLFPGTTYHFQLVAYNGAGISYGDDLTLLTPAEAPVVVTEPATGITASSATLNATVNPEYSPTAVYFGWGTTTNLGNLTTPTNLTTGLASNQPVSATISNLQPGTIYYFQAVGVNSGGTTFGSMEVFSTPTQGGYSSNNFIGFPQPLFGGPGGHLYVPVMVELSNAILESVQFRVEVNANQAGAPMIAPIGLQPLTPDDLVPLTGPAPGNTPVAFETFAYTTSSNGQGLVIAAAGSGSGLNMQSSGVVVMLHLAIPSTATLGQSYSLNVLTPSGTSDGQQATVGLNTLPVQTLTISDPAYMVGDSSPSAGYNSGQFGNGALDSSDVNNAIYASVGIRVPPSDSDLYNAMDAWPPDAAGRGGDGFIRLLDWETILGRSVGVSLYPGMDTNNYVRFWTNGDIGFPSHAVVDWVPGGPAVPLSLDPAPDSAGSSPTKLSLSNDPPGLVWFCQAAVGSGTITNSLPGNTCSLPVYVNVVPGYSLAALQFRAIVTGSSGAPSVASIQFNPAGGVPAPQVLAGLAGNDKVQLWPFGSFAVPLHNSNYLGTVSFQVPAGASPGASYALHFVGVDGAPDGSTAYQLESHPGSAWVMSGAQQPASITSDEWKIAFFGSLTNGLAGDDVDADGDGSLNWQEYLAGTNPTDALSRLQFSSASFYTNGVRGVAINWLTAPGKTYNLQSSPALIGAPWTPINSNIGDGNEYQFIVTNYSGGARFYQIQLQP
jgi:hypothetical protein